MPDQNLPTQLIPIEEIRPDPTQPRKLLPPELAEMLASGASPFDILDRLRARATHSKWTRERLRKLDALAKSIEEDGLMNPIRVIRDDNDHYRIEEGERRYWAHHILVQQGKEQFQTIAAFVIERGDALSGLLRRRVAENVLRSEFTPIELARAMASRIQEILAAEPNTKRFEAERRVGKENGMSDRRVRQFVALLTLSPQVQELAQQAHLSENSLRRIVGIKDAARQLAAVRELMHPSQKKTVSNPASRSKRHRPQSPQSSIRSHNRIKRGNVATVSSHRRASLGGMVKGSSQDNDVKKITQTIQQILNLAGYVSVKDWKQGMQTGINRRALARLRDALGSALDASKQKN